jgi:TPR repeat protein
MNNLAILYRDGLGMSANYSEARRLLEAAAGSGNREALTSLGWLHERGLGAPKSLARACELYRQAASLGDEVGKKNVQVVCSGRKN